MNLEKKENSENIAIYTRYVHIQVKGPFLGLFKAGLFGFQA